MYAEFRSARSGGHVEEQLYDRFFSNADHRLMTVFHDASWPDRLSIIEQFEDARLQKLGYRLLYDERPDLFDEASRRRHDDRIARRLLGLDNDVPWLTLREGIQQANSPIERAPLHRTSSNTGTSFNGGWLKSCA